MKQFNIPAWAWVGAVVFMAGAATTAQAELAPVSTSERSSAQMSVDFNSAIESFRKGQLADAYGRFIQLANRGHADSARYALLMCEHGLNLFGRDWDCAPDSVAAWARSAGVPAPRIAVRHYAASASSPVTEQP